MRKFGAGEPGQLRCPRRLRPGNCDRVDSDCQSTTCLPSRM
jgi:hypothetical protein